MASESNFDNSKWIRRNGGERGDKEVRRYGDKEEENYEPWTVDRIAKKS